MSTEEITKRVGIDVKDNPRTSIVTPAYNVAEFIAATLDSAFAQTDGDFELIVVNDGSPDTERLEAALAPYLARIVYIRQVNADAASIARNTGIENARGEFIAFLDGDDLWYADYLERQHKFMAAGGFSMVYCDAELFGMPSVEGHTFTEQAPSSGTCDVDALLDLRCSVITSGTIASKAAIEKAGMFERERIQGEDFNLWVRIANSGFRIGYQRDVLLKYRISPTGFSADSINRVQRSIDVFNRVARDIDLTDHQRSIIRRRIKGFEADLAVEKGKAFLLGGDYQQARNSFSEANRHRRSLKLRAITLLTKLAPRILTKLFRSRNADEIAFIPRLNEAGDQNKL